MFLYVYHLYLAKQKENKASMKTLLEVQKFVRICHTAMTNEFMNVMAISGQAESMPPKRKAASATKAGGKKIKKEPKAPAKDKFTSAKEALKATGPQVKANRKPDSLCHLSNAEVKTNYFMLQTLVCKFFVDENLQNYLQVYTISHLFWHSNCIHLLYFSSVLVALVKKRKNKSLITK